VCQSIYLCFVVLLFLQEPVDLEAAAAAQQAGSKRPLSSEHVYSLFAAWFAPQQSLEMVRIGCLCLIVR
jgi:hypothetical protein